MLGDLLCARQPGSPVTDDHQARPVGELYRRGRTGVERMAIAEHLQCLGQSDRGDPPDVGDLEGAEKAPLRIELEIIADIQPSPGDRTDRAACVATVR